MIEVFILLIGVSFLATFCNFNISNKKISITSNIIFTIICIIFILFAGLRTQMNDTGLYIYRYNIEPYNFNNINWSIGANPFFYLYQCILHSIKCNGYWFIFITALITETSYLLFIRKYAKDFPFTIYLFIAFTVFAFSMAAMKQVLSVAIAIWSIPLFLNKKYVYSILLIGIAVLFHPYVFLYISMFFLNKNIFDKKVMLIIFLTLIMGYSFTSIVETLSEMTSSVTGDIYSVEELSSQGVGIQRVLFYMIVPILSFISRDKIRNENNEFLYISVNLCLIAACFSFISLFGGSFTFGRIVNYFDIIICITLPIVFNIRFGKSKYYYILKIIFYFVFFIFYITYYKKYYNGDIFVCFYNHISILKLFGM